MTSSDEQQHGRHPTFKQYVVVATILFIITIVEFLIIFPNKDLIGAAKIPVLVFLSAIKFGIVAGSIPLRSILNFDLELFLGSFDTSLDCEPPPPDRSRRSGKQGRFHRRVGSLCRSGDSSPLPPQS